MSESQATTVSATDETHAIERKALLRSTDDFAVKRLPPSEFAKLPRIFVLPTHLQEDEVHDLEDSLASVGARVTQKLHEARLMLSAIGTQRRAKYELQIRGLGTVPVSQGAKPPVPAKRSSDIESEPNKRRKTISHASASGSNDEVSDSEDEPRRKDGETTSPSSESVVRVVRKEWLQDSITSGQILDLAKYLVYEATIVETKRTTQAVKRYGKQQDSPTIHKFQTAESPLKKAGGRVAGEGKRDRNADAVANQLADRKFMPSGYGSSSKRRLVTETTSEHEEGGRDLSEMPDWVLQNKMYACERSAPANSPNEGFVSQLKKIRLARTLIGDEVGVRAYSTSIASLLACPFELTHSKEILALPGCNDKIAVLFQEYREHGRLRAADEVDKDPVLSVIHEFYKIWGVGAATAREFYHDRGWRSHDDVIEYGWNTLSRHQQIGLKFFDDFELKMSRSEVEYIASVVTYCAKQQVDDGIQCTIVGGYRRGSRELSDVDLIISHPEEEATRFLIGPLIKDLEEIGWVTHTLTLSETTSNRDQDTLPLKSLQRTGGFDTLDKALVVWQDPNWTNKEADLERDPKAKNPNVHRRVDIIIAPWKVVGCAVMGWTSGTTFQRDLRRYCRKAKGWKFDSSGVRDLATGRWIDLEGWHDPAMRARTCEDAERRVFDGLGLQWRPPDERNTG